MNKVIRVAAVLVTTLLASACGQGRNDSSEASPSPLGPASVNQQAPMVPPPSGSSFKNCRGGKNIQWWVAHIDTVTTADLQALAALNLKNADRSDFDPEDVDTLAAWLKAGVRAEDIAYAVSAQLAAGELNVRHGHVHDAGTFVVRDQANLELGRENPSIAWLETLLFEFRRCQ